MNNSIKILCAVLAIMMIISCLVGCGVEKKETEPEKAKITTANDAISAVRNGKYFSVVHRENVSLDDKIAISLHFSTHMDASYGHCEAEKDETGVWKVTLKGSMYGWGGEYGNESAEREFEVTADVSETGDVNNLNIKRMTW